MDAIRLKNLRNLNDTGFIQIKPITFLLGSNSSGKSTFLRSFPLIRQSVTTRTIGPILWYGELVDFGSFNEALNSKSYVKEISFIYKFRIPALPSYEDRTHYAWLRLYNTVPLIEDLDVTIELEMTAAENRKGVTVCKKCSLQISDHQIVIEMNASGDVVRLEVNENNFLLQGLKLRADQTVGLIPQIYKKKDDNNDVDVLHYSSAYSRKRAAIFSGRLVEAVKGLVHYSTSYEKIAYLVRGLGLGSSEAMLANMRNTNRGKETWKKNAKKWDTKNNEYKQIRDLVIANSLINIMSSCDDYISKFAEDVSYIGPVRATAERYYRSQDLAVGEVDSQGKNLAMFLRNLTDNQRKAFASWTEKNFGFAVLIIASEGHISLKIREENLPTDTNLADTGFGFSQVLPILTQLWWLGRKPTPSGVRSPYPVTFTIEQPELHLHPKLQALFADSLITAIKASRKSGIDLRLIIETHSQTLINRFGHRIANNDFDREDINVVLFERKALDEAVNIRIASYNEEGFLDNWPFGFFEPDMI